MPQKLTILFVPMEGVGHVNACIGLAEVLLSRGHKVVFAVDKSYEGRLTSLGFDEELVETNIKKKDLRPGEGVADLISKTGLMSGLSSLEKLKLMMNSNFLQELIDKTIETIPRLQEIVDKHNPDLYILDHFCGLPMFVHSDKPWVFLWSANPLYVIRDERTPPGGSGYPTNGDKKEWKEFSDLMEISSKQNSKQFNEWLKDNGFPENTNNKTIPDSTYLNIYGFPEELDYTDLRPMPDKWFAVDTFSRQGEHKFELPEKLENRDKTKEKLIYLSLGSMGSIDVQLMKRLVNILSKSPHKFIVSKGLAGDQYELADNMWGQNSVPQTKVLALVDLVITHGGNNTTTETFSAGKPMIVMPLFGDQFDNAQRVQEKGFGIRLDPYNCTEQELLEGIEKVLNNRELKDRLKAASKRIEVDQKLVRASQLIEDLVV